MCNIALPMLADLKNAQSLMLVASLAACSGKQAGPPPEERSIRQEPLAAPKQAVPAAQCPGESHNGWCKYKLSIHQVRRLWGTSDQDVWAVGAGEANLHWDGHVWSEVPKATDKPLYALWGAGPKDVWAGGEDGVIVHWDGTKWSVVPSGTKQWIFGMWGSGPTDVWAMSSKGTSLHWDGKRWAVGRIGTPSDSFGGIWGSGPDDVWALAETGVIAHWDGKRWSKVESGVQSDLQDVWGSGPKDAWIAGDKGTLLHWDGTAWTSKAPTTGNAVSYKSIEGGPSGILLIASGNDARLDRIMRFDGTEWSVVHDRTDALLEHVWVDRSGAAWAAGWNGGAWHLPAR